MSMTQSITIAELSEYGDSLDLFLLTANARELFNRYRRLRKVAFAQSALAKSMTELKEVISFTKLFHQLMEEANMIGNRLVVLTDDGAKIIVQNPNALDFPVAKEPLQ